MTSLDGKKVIIFGGCSGIGLGVAKVALDKGAEVFIVGRSSDKLGAAERRSAKMPSCAASRRTLPRKRITSNGGLIVLRESALRSGVAAVVADAVPDTRNRLLVTHSYRAKVTAHDGDRGGP